MANFTASNLVKAQALLNQNFQSSELRVQRSPILGLGLQNANILIPAHNELRTREDRPIDAHIIKRNLRTTTGMTRTHDHTGVLGDSMAVPVTFVQFVDKFQMTLKWLDNNLYNFDEILANQFFQAFQNINIGIEAHLTDFMATKKTQVNVATKNGTFDATKHVFEIKSSATDKVGLVFEDAKSMMRQNHYQGVYDVVCDPKLYRDAAFYAAQGGANATNLGFQFGGMNIVESITVNDSAYTGGIAFFLPVNTFAVLDWIPVQNRRGVGDYNSYVGGFGAMRDPISGLTFAVHAYQQRANTASRNGNSQDVVMEFEVSVDISANVAPLSTATETVVFQVAQVAA